MSEPTQIEKKIVMDILGKEEWSPNCIGHQEDVEDAVRAALHRELVERRLRAEYLGQSSITGRNPHEERID